MKKFLLLFFGVLIISASLSSCGSTTDSMSVRVEVIYTNTDKEVITMLCKSPDYIHLDRGCITAWTGNQHNTARCGVRSFKIIN